MKGLLLTCAVGLLAGSAYGQAPDLSGVTQHYAALASNTPSPGGDHGTQGGVSYNDGIIHTPVLTDNLLPLGVDCGSTNCGPAYAPPRGAGDHAHQGGIAASVPLTVLRGSGDVSLCVPNHHGYDAPRGGKVA